MISNQIGKLFKWKEKKGKRKKYKREKEKKEENKKKGNKYIWWANVSLVHWIHVHR